MGLGQWRQQPGCKPSGWRETAPGSGAQVARGPADLPSGRGAEHPDDTQSRATATQFGAVTMTARYLASVVVAGSMIVAAGCGGKYAAPAPPSPAPASSPIPPVKNPRDVAAMARRPCALLTSQQATRFGFDLPPQELDGLFGTLDCRWSKTTREQELVRSLIISMFTNN